MQYELEIGGHLRQATVHHAADLVIVELDGVSWTVDAARVDSQSMSLILGGADSHEVTIVPDGRSGRLLVTVGTTSIPAAFNGRRRRGARAVGVTGDGPQQILAPMPGKVVRVLAGKGDAVHARQPVIVIEAMKMENELRAGRDGVVAEIHAREGQSVEAGELLAVVAAAPGPC